jgi:hypothetical protein
MTEYIYKEPRTFSPRSLKNEIASPPDQTE